jgi:tetratricopeptide (TPR) repeat protein
MKKILILFCFFSYCSIFSQESTDLQLAQYYYSNGEYIKAKTYYAKLYQEDQSKVIFDRYYDCLLKTEDYKRAEKVLKNVNDVQKKDVNYKILFAEFYHLSGNEKKSEKLYEDIITDLIPFHKQIIETYDAFIRNDKIDYAYKSLVRGRKLLKKDYPLNMQFANYFELVGEKEKMLNEYFSLLKDYPGFQSAVKGKLSSNMDLSNPSSEDYNLLRVRFLKGIQSDPNNEAFQEMLTWLFIEGGNFSGALTQTIAIDKREGKDGNGVYELGNYCLTLKEYKTAKKAFQYVVDLGEDSDFYFSAYVKSLETTFTEVQENSNLDKSEYLQAVNDFEKALNTFGRDRSTIRLILQKSQIQAFFLDSASVAIKELQDALNFPGLTDKLRAEIKMQLADILVLKGDIWEASLLFMQIDKDFKFEPIGHEAKFKNARIYYYDGEFEFAQSQLNVLKESTSKLIANNAMELSLLITENYGLDSNYQAMFWFASAELLIEKHQFKEAYSLMDSITINFPYHSLSDEIFLKKAKVELSQGNIEKAIGFLEKIMKYHSEDILADDALFLLGDIYQNKLLDKEKASEVYKKILFNYKGSLHVVEARKRYRYLRGDKTVVEEKKSLD